MTLPTVPTMPATANKSGCTSPYTIQDVRRTIQRLKDANLSYRQIAREVYGGKITHAVVQRVLDGLEPKEPHIREALGLPAYHQVVVIMPGGDVPPGTQVISASLCECGQYFISNHPARKKCFICSPFKKRPK